MTQNNLTTHKTGQGFVLKFGFLLLSSALLLSTPVFAQDSLLERPETQQPLTKPSETPQAGQNQTPRKDVLPKDRLDALEPFDPESRNLGSLEKNGDLPDHIDPDLLDDELRDLLLNLPDADADENSESLSDRSDEANEAVDSSDIKPDTPDYSQLSKKGEQSARLDALFERLGRETDAELADLIAEEIWAIWLDSGSASVDLLIRRGTAAQKRRDFALARRMYDHATAIKPDYAEGWSRSARLAIEEDDLGRALTEVTETLIREPRHFYALWTMGNLLERLGRTDAALEAYVEANKLYPELKAVKDRVEMMRGSVEGNVL